MIRSPLFAAMLCACALGATSASAADAPAAKAKKPALPKTNYVDLSSQALLDAASAKTLMGEAVPAKIWKLYPAGKWAFVSQVEGGMTPAGACVVTARAMLAPLSLGNKVLLKPEKMATAFDTQAGATREQCQALAKGKLKEAVDAVVSSLVKT